MVKSRSEDVILHPSSLLMIHYNAVCRVVPILKTAHTHIIQLKEKQQETNERLLFQ